MSKATGAKQPPRTGHYPGQPLPDSSIGGQVGGAGITGGTARLLDGATGSLTTNVMDAETGLYQHSDGKWYYRFDGVPTGSYTVQVTTNEGGAYGTGTVSPGQVSNATAT